MKNEDGFAGVLVGKQKGECSCWPRFKPPVASEATLIPLWVSCIDYLKDVSTILSELHGGTEWEPVSSPSSLVLPCVNVTVAQSGSGCKAGTTGLGPPEVPTNVSGKEDYLAWTRTLGSSILADVRWAVTAHPLNPYSEARDLPITQTFGEFQLMTYGTMNHGCGTLVSSCVNFGIL